METETPWAAAFLAVTLPHRSGPLVDLWVAALETAGKAEWTQYQYKREVSTLLARFEEKAAEELTSLDLQLWAHERGRGKAATTKRRSMIAARSFFDWMVRNDVIIRSPTRALELPPVDEPEPTFWTPEEVRAIVGAAKTPRDRLLLETLARAGQRVSPTRRLTWDRVHFDVDKPYIAFPRAKGGKHHQVPMDRTLYRAFKAYHQLVGEPRDGYIFPSRQRRKRDAPGTPPGPMMGNQVWRILVAACEAAGVRVAGPHEMRRSLATHLLTNPKVPFHVVSKGVLDHSNPQTTMKHYAGLDFDQVAAALTDSF